MNRRPKNGPHSIVPTTFLTGISAFRKIYISRGAKGDTSVE